MFWIILFFNNEILYVYFLKNGNGSQVITFEKQTIFDGFSNVPNVIYIFKLKAYYQTFSLLIMLVPPLMNSLVINMSIVSLLHNQMAEKKLMKKQDLN